jgi:hypothetical protein
MKQHFEKSPMDDTAKRKSRVHAHASNAVASLRKVALALACAAFAGNWHRSREPTADRRESVHCGGGRFLCANHT